MDNGLFPVFGDYNKIINIHVQVSMWTCFNISWIHNQSKINGSYDKFMSDTFFSKVTSFYILTSNVLGFPFLHILPNMCYYLFYYNRPHGGISLWF